MPKPRVIHIFKACESLGFVEREVASGLVLNVPEWQLFKAKLPAYGAKPKIDEYKSLQEMLEAFGLGKKFSGRVTLWESGKYRRLKDPVCRRVKKSGGRGGDAMLRRLPGHYGGNQ